MLGNYFKTAVRNFFRHKIYSLINVFGLSVGLACCLLIFLWVKYEWSYDRFHQNLDDIHRVVVSWPRGNDTVWHWRTPPPLAPALKQDFPEVLSSSRFYTTSGVLVEYQQTRFKETIGFADSDLFSIFTLPLRQGPPADLLSDPQSVVISKSTALKFFGNADPIGKSVTLHGKWSFQVAAVMEDIPKHSLLNCPIIVPFRYLWIFSEMGKEDEWGDFGYNTFVLLKKNTNSGVMNNKLKDYLDIKWEDPENDTVLSLQPLERIHLYSLGGGGPIVFIWIFSAVAAFILLIACINFMNLSTARSSTRALEIGVRKVVGADRSRIIFQFLSESLLLSFTSLIFALVIVGLLLKPLARLAEVPAGGLLLDIKIIPIVLLVSLAAGVAAGGYPAFFLSSFRPVDVMKGRRKSGSPIFRRVLVVFQFSVSIFLLVGMLIISRQIGYMSRMPLGFAKEQIVYLPMNGDLQERYDTFRHEILQNPNVMNMALVSNYLGRSSMWSTSGVRWDGMSGNENINLNLIYADYDMAETFGLKISSGRYFSREFQTDSANFVFNETAVGILGLENPIGTQMTIAGQEGEVVGILKDFHFRSLHSGMQPLAIIMQPLYFRYAAVKIANTDLPGTLAFIERTFSQFSPKYPFESSFLDEVLGDQYKEEQRSRLLLKFFVALAGIISCLGLFGLSSFMAEKRTKEIGVRKILGATKLGIFILLSKTYIGWVAAANIIAFPLVYLSMDRWLRNFAYRETINWQSFVAAGLVSLGIAILTVAGQTIKISKTNPAHALKHE